MATPKEVYLPLGGGLGDVFYTYHKGQLGWGFLQSLKETYPHVKTKVLCSTHNPQTLEFIKYNPYIDEAHEYGWVLDGRQLWNKYKGQAVRFSEQKGLLNKLKRKKTYVYLSEEDNKVIDNIVSAGPFVVVHPFAGEPHRKGMPVEEYYPLIDQIIERKNLNVVVIGGSYGRHNRKKTEDKIEEFNYSRDRVFNLVGKTNARVCMTLTGKQYRFIGCWSAYSCASWLNNKKTTIILHRKYKQQLREKFGPGQKWKGSKCAIIGTEGPACNPGNTNFDKIRQRVLLSIHPVS